MLAVERRFGSTERASEGYVVSGIEPARGGTHKVSLCLDDGGWRMVEASGCT